MENIGKFTTVLFIMVISPIIKGFVMKTLWAWFVVPIFEVNPLRMIEAIGLMFFINYIKHKRSKDLDNSDVWVDLAKTLISLIVTAVFALLSGWITQMFM